MFGCLIGGNSNGSWRAPPLLKPEPNLHADIQVPDAPGLVSVTLNCFWALAGLGSGPGLVALTLHCRSKPWAGSKGCVLQIWRATLVRSLLNQNAAMMYLPLDGVQGVCQGTSLIPSSYGARVSFCHVSPSVVTPNNIAIRQGDRIPPKEACCLPIS